jgi:hypothetical protein
MLCAFYWFVFLLFVPKFCRIHCTGADGYTSSEVIGSENPDMIYDEIKLGGFKVQNTSPGGALGRCFIEVDLHIFFPAYDYGVSSHTHAYLKSFHVREVYICELLLRIASSIKKIIAT